jgi:hypothetical protein
MRRVITRALLVAATALASSGASAQTAMLAPPDNRYFTGQGSWGQKYSDQSGSTPRRIRHGGW